MVEMYCSKDMRSFNRIPEKDRVWMRKYLGKVACWFVCDKVEKFVVGSLACDTVQEKACLSYKEICDYFYGDNYDNTVRIGYAWHITNLKIYDTPRKLGEFNGFKKCNQCKASGYDSSACMYDEDCVIPVPIEKAPQSWQFVYEE